MICDKKYEPISVPVYKQVIKTTAIITEYSLPTTYKTLSKIHFSQSTPHINKITVDHRCGFRRNTSTTDQTFCIRRMLEKKRV